jgi:hypothetical protein
MVKYYSVLLFITLEGVEMAVRRNIFIAMVTTIILAVSLLTGCGNCAQEEATIEVVAHSSLGKWGNVEISGVAYNETIWSSDLNNGSILVRVPPGKVHIEYTLYYEPDSTTEKRLREEFSDSVNIEAYNAELDDIEQELEEQGYTLEEAIDSGIVGGPGFTGEYEWEIDRWIVTLSADDDLQPGDHITTRITDVGDGKFLQILEDPVDLHPEWDG